MEFQVHLMPTNILSEYEQKLSETEVPHSIELMNVYKNHLNIILPIPTIYSNSSKVKLRDTFLWETFWSGSHIYAYKQLLDTHTSEEKSVF